MRADNHRRLFLRGGYHALHRVIVGVLVFNDTILVTADGDIGRRHRRHIPFDICRSHAPYIDTSARRFLCLIHIHHDRTDLYKNLICFLFLLASM